MRTIVFSGHGAWLPSDGYTKLPGNCSIEFYTENSKTLSDALGGDLDRGMTTGLSPDQRGAGFSTVTNMRLYYPSGLNIKEPDKATWQVFRLGIDMLPVGNKNLQFQVSSTYVDGIDLASILRTLNPTLHNSGPTLLIWAACREIGLRDAGGTAYGVNTMQR